MAASRGKAEWKRGVKEKAPGIVPIHDVNAESVLKNDETMGGTPAALILLFHGASSDARRPTFDVWRSTSVHARVASLIERS